MILVFFSLSQLTQINPQNLDDGIQIQIRNNKQDEWKSCKINNRFIHGAPSINLQYLSSGKNENNTFEPSNGGTGIKLKMPNPVEINPVYVNVFDIKYPTLDIIKYGANLQSA